MINSTLPTAPASAPGTEPGTGSTVAERPVLSLSMTAIASGSLAAVTSAVVGSHLGTGGTLVGAAVGSAIGAVATALYTFGLERTRHALAAMTPRRATLVGGVLLSALVAFVVSVGAITGMEKAAGTSLGGQPGTTVGRAVEARTSPSGTEKETPSEPVSAPAVAAAPTATPTPVASAEPTPAAVSADPAARPTTSPQPEPAPTSTPAEPAPTPTAAGAVASH